MILKHVYRTMFSVCAHKDTRDALHMFCPQFYVLRNEPVSSCGNSDCVVPASHSYFPEASILSSGQVVLCNYSMRNIINSVFQR